MEPDASTDFQQLISEIFEQQPNDGLKGVLRCFLLDDKFQMVYDYKSKLESGGSYLAGTFLRSDTIDKDLTVFNHMSETFDTGKKMEEFFGEQQFYTSKIFGGQFSLCVVYVKGEKPGVVWSLGFVCFSGFSNDALLIEIGKQLAPSVRSLCRCLKA